jgi:hypothetical protein
MGFALELANAGNAGLPDAWEVPPAAPRHRKPLRSKLLRSKLLYSKLLRTRRLGLVGVARRAVAAVTTLPTHGDHRRAF